VNGLLFKGQNGNSLFIPAAGSRWDSTLSLDGSTGNYWSSALVTTFAPSNAWDFCFDSGGRSMNQSSRNNGHSVRAVRQH
jgi:hypothetical protein